jgi:tRNA pseudouridine38-40 synthase
MATTYRLTMEYEGTRYRGFQEQKNARTVAGELRAAIESGLGARVDLGGAGRTDAGVHALGQVAHLKVERELPRRFAVELNDRLPPDIHVLDCRKAPERFHARHHAQARSYLYQIARRRTALAKRFVWWVKRPLDAAALEAAASRLAGRHDFGAFCERREEATSTLVVVERCEALAAGDLILVRIVASHFLWKMVRRLIGTLVEIAAGQLAPDGLDRLLAGESEQAVGFAPAAATAPPSGLFLERVLYEGERPIPALSAEAAVTPLPV